jgi:hypothetical protein
MKEIADKGSKKVIDMMEFGFAWSRNDAHKIHVLDVILKVKWKVHTNHVYTPHHTVLTRYLVAEGIKPINVQIEDESEFVWMP